MEKCESCKQELKVAQYALLMEMFISPARNVQATVGTITAFTSVLTILDNAQACYSCESIRPAKLLRPVQIQ